MQAAVAGVVVGGELDLGRSREIFMPERCGLFWKIFPESFLVWRSTTQIDARFFPNCALSLITSCFSRIKRDRLDLTQSAHGGSGHLAADDTASTACHAATASPSRWIAGELLVRPPSQDLQ